MWLVQRWVASGHALDDRSAEGHVTASIPLVGLTTYAENASWGPWKRDVALVPAAYYELVAAAGGRPVLIPQARRHPGGAAAGSAKVIAALDALVVIGGLDVDPALYGEPADPELGRVDPDRDLSELGLLRAAIDADVPVLAICRGHQLLNVALGGTLIQHVPDVVGNIVHQPAGGAFTTHEVTCLAGTRTARIFGEAPVVACSHHQAIGRLAEGLEATAWSIEAQGVAPLVEAVERPASRFCVGVQWHPEETGDARPFDALIAACG
jgi:anthranilate synthase component 2/putative glutamine amidotransferase